LAITTTANIHSPADEGDFHDVATT
jgi:hypothetical protein